MNRAGLLELIAGKTRSNTAAAILSNTKDLEEAYKSAMEAEGSALKENETYLDSIQGRIDQFTNALQTFWNNLLNSDIVKWFVTLGTKIIELTNKFGELRSVIFVFLAYMSITKKWDFAKWFFGPEDVNVILKGLSKIKTMLGGIKSMFGGKSSENLLALMAPGIPSPGGSTESTSKTPPPSGGYTLLGAGASSSGETDNGPEPIDLDKVFGSRFKHMWNNHMSRLRDSAHRVKQDLADIWQHHNERVEQSMQYASDQFNKLKTSASNVLNATVKIVGNVTNNIRNAFSKFFSQTKGSTYKTSSVVPYIGGEKETTKQTNRFSQIWQNHMTRLRDSIGRVKQDFSTIWQHHNERVAESVKYAGAQFDKLKTSSSNVFNNIAKSVSNVVNNIRVKFGQIADIMTAKTPIARSKATRKSAQSSTSVATTTSDIATAYTAQSRSSERESIDFDKMFNRNMWQRHMDRVRASAKRVQDDLSRIWENHNIRVEQSVAYASQQFDKLKNAVTQKIRGVAQVVGNITNSIRNAFGKMFATKDTSKQTTQQALLQPGQVVPYDSGKQGSTSDSKQAGRFNQMWQNHISRLRDSVSRLKADFSTLWQHHTERMSASVKNVSVQFNKMKASITNVWHSVSKTISNVANSMRNGFVKATSKGAWYEDESGRVGRAEVLPRSLPDTYESSEQSYSKIDEIITRIRTNIGNTVQMGKIAFANLASSVGAQFNQIKTNVSNSIRDTFNNIVSSVKNAVNAASASFKNIKSKFSRKSTTVSIPEIDGSQSSSKTTSRASKVAAEVSRIWKKHIDNLKGNYNAIKDEITTIWSNHKIRVRDSVAHASQDFNNLKNHFSKVAGIISTKVHGVGVAFKAKFGDAFKYVQNGFSKLGSFANNIFNKIKTFASNTAKAFKESLGYKHGGTTQGTSATVDPTAWLNAGSQLGNKPLAMGEDAAAKIDLVNAKMQEGQVALNDYMSSLGGTDKAFQAYVASLDGGQASIQGFNSFINTHNAGLKASGVAAKLAAVGHAALNAAISMGLSVLIQFVMEGLMKLIDYLKALANPTEKLAEDISDLKSEIGNTESEIDSINDKLDTCRDRMAELLALPSLSFVEQEELNNLRKEIALLERKLALEKALLAREEAKLVSDTEDYIVESWNEQGTYNVKNFEKNKGVIRKDKGWSGFWDDSKTTAEVLDESMAIYKERDSAIVDAENILLNLNSSSKKERREALKALNIDYDDLAGDISMSDKNKALSGDADAFEKVIDAAKSVNMEVAKSIDAVFNDPQYAGLTYGMSTDIDTFLDEFYAYQNKWNVMLGQASKSDDIASLFDATASKEMQALGTQLREIADDESLSIDKQNEKIKGVIGSIDLENEAYRRLKSTMDIIGVTAQDIADYFTLETGVFDSDTIDGITAQYAKASNVMKELQNMGSSDTFTVDGATYNWNEFFSEDDAGKFEARADKFAEILKGMDKDTRETFMSLSEQVKNGSISWDDAIKSLNLSGLVAASKLIEEQFSELNKSVFKGLEDDLSGFIDTFSELSSALEDVASSMDLLKTAEQQMNSSGRISIKTALELIESTDRWNEVLTIENGKVTLNANAEDVLVQSKLNVIKANIQEALSSARLQLAQLGTANATLVSAEASDVTTEAYAIYTDAMNTYSASIAGFGAALGALLEGDFLNIGSAFRSAYDATLTVKDHEATVASEDLTQKIADLEAQAKMLEHIDTSGEFGNYYDYNKTPGDKYGDDLDGNGYEDEDGFLDDLRNKYERQIENLDNQQTYIQNEIDRLEAEDQTVSKSYYEEQIALEEEKLGLYQQERDALLELKMTDDVAAALWEVEHAIQESTMRMVEFRQSIVDLYVDAFDKVIGAFDNSDDFLSDQQNYIDKYQELMELQGGTKAAGGFQEKIAIEQEKLTDNIAELNALRETLDYAMANGLEEGSEEWIDMQDKIRAAEEAVLDNKIAIEQYNQELKQLSVDAFELVRNAFSSKDQFLTNQQDYMQGYADLLEAQGIDVPEKLYEELIAVERQKRANNVENLVDARQGLADIEAAGYTAADEEWQDAYQQVVELEKAVQDNDIAMVEWEKTIRDMDFEKFDRFIGRLDDIHSEIDNVRGLFDDDDVAFNDGTWTEEGITSLGLAYQQMELAQQKSQEYAGKIEELNTAYQNGEMSEREYYDRLQELKDGQWDSIKAYEGAKDAIVDMEEARIDMIEEGLNEEIDAYSELIELKKEELDAERDLYDFKKKVKSQTKDLAELDRRIASLSGSTADADIAELRKLQAERRELQENLDDEYYQHSMDSQGRALDDELTTFRETREDYIESLRETLEDTATIITEKITDVLGNADTVMNTLNTKSGEYGVTLSANLMLPWTTASETALAFKQSVDNNLPLLTNEDGVVTVFGDTAKTVFESAFGAGSTACGTFKTTVETDIAAIKLVVSNSTSELTSGISFPWNDATKKDGPISTFSTKVKDAINTALTTAKNNASSMKSNLASPWTTTAINTWSTSVKTVLEQAQKDAAKAGAEISKSLNVKAPSYTGATTTPTHNNTKTTITQTQKKITTTEKSMHKTGTLGQSFIVGSQSYFDSKCVTIGGVKYYPRVVTDRDGKSTTYYYKASEAERRRYDGSRTTGLGFPKGTGVYKYYAKGTLGTNKDEFAITDESWIGEEITLAAGKNGQLQYLKKGSAVMPADISENLVEWGKLNPNMMAMTNASQGVNILSNYVNKPELNLSFEALVKAERITQETLPAVKKLVTEELDKFTRKLNYAIKRA